MIRAHDDTSAALLGAAHRLLATEGPDALTVRRIATEAGMSTMNVYSRFGGKAGVIDELYADGFQRLLAAIEGVTHTDAAVDDLVAMAIAYRRFAVENPRFYEIMFGKFTASPQAMQAGATGLDSYVQRVERAVDDSAIRLPDDLDPKSAAVWLWATCHGMVSLELNGLANDSIDWEQVYSAGIRAVLEGIGNNNGASAHPA
jgi:AcrR family transcriptional regulator